MQAEPWIYDRNNSKTNGRRSWMQGEPRARAGTNTVRAVQLSGDSEGAETDQLSCQVCGRRSCSKLKPPSGGFVVCAWSEVRATEARFGRFPCAKAAIGFIGRRLATVSTKALATKNLSAARMHRITNARASIVGTRHACPRGVRCVAPFSDRKKFPRRNPDIKTCRIRQRASQSATNARKSRAIRVIRSRCTGVAKGPRKMLISFPPRIRQGAARV